MSALTGFCRSALDMDRLGHGGSVSNELHSNCRGSFLNVFKDLQECECNCHIYRGTQRDVSAEIRQARYDKAIAEGTATDPETINRRTKSHCKHGHAMTEGNVGPGNVCRTCKRLSSQKHKERHAHE